MSQIWVIKNNAPVDSTSYSLETTNISFTTNKQKATSFGIIKSPDIVFEVTYGGIGVVGRFDPITMASFEWDNEAYKTLEFDTTPTGELLAWLQKNADKQVDTEYLTRKSELTSIADAIREKGGTSDSLVYPDGFVTAIQAIQTGTELQIIVTVASGATVTATKGSLSVSGTSVNGTCTLTVSEAGTWSVSATLGGQTSDTKNVTFTDRYALALNFLNSNFADNDWDSIIATCHSGSVPSTWVVGNSKTMTINGASYQVDIIGKNHDTYTAGGKAPLTFQLHDCYADTKAMNGSNTNSGGWTRCAMRSTHLPAILALMPTEVQNGIREVNKLTSAGSQSSTINTTADKLFLLSEVEIYGSTFYSAAGEGTQYDYYKAGNSKSKKRNGSAFYWWERSPFVENSTVFCIVKDNGNMEVGLASYAEGVSFGFCF